MLWSSSLASQFGSCQTNQILILSIFPASDTSTLRTTCSLAASCVPLTDAMMKRQSVLFTRSQVWSSLDWPWRWILSVELLNILESVKNLCTNPMTQYHQSLEIHSLGRRPGSVIIIWTSCPAVRSRALTCGAPKAFYHPFSSCNSNLAYLIKVTSADIYNI